MLQLRYSYSVGARCIIAAMATQGMLLSFACDAVLPIPVALVSFGFSRQSGQDFTERAEGMGCHIIDLRTYLKKDPRQTVGHDKNYTDPHVQRVVMSQDGFPTAVRDVVDWLKCGCYYIGGGCTAGNHRSPVILQVAASIANSIDVMHNGTKQRAFNAQHFSLSENSNQKDVSRMLNNVQWWSHGDPWCVVPGGYDTNGMLWGGTTACLDAKAASNYNEAVLMALEGCTPIINVSQSVGAAAPPATEGGGVAPGPSGGADAAGTRPAWATWNSGTDADAAVWYDVLVDIRVDDSALTGGRSTAIQPGSLQTR